MSDEERARQEFKAFTAIRLMGLALFLGGIAIAFSDILKPGGWPLLGGILAITGALEAVFATHVRRRASRRK
ncbi:MAG: hypothetical protein H0W65_01400 [Sphingomonas sp.]|uniref:hypothetical protein n=1 Tax=Sphingomonas sp. TaxID=28214 RepID=UPI001843DF85|nr:hypothetical protein [Sphingomonas sp.]MBA3666365.1 hypothetical protein [Sphingomonas sp.]